VRNHAPAVRYTHGRTGEQLVDVCRTPEGAARAVEHLQLNGHRDIRPVTVAIQDREIVEVIG